jgi:alanine racemase
MRAVQALLCPKVAICAVVKANAYGHGVAEIAQAAVKGGAAFLGITSIEEAEKIRKLDSKTRILRMMPSNPGEYRWNQILGVDEMVCDLEAAQRLSELAAQTGSPIRVHVKVDTGMGRQGVLWERAVETVFDVARIRGLRLVGIMTHFAEAPRMGSEFTEIQIDRFRKILDALRDRGIRPPYAHAANSAGLMCYANSHFSMVRSGLAIYGISPVHVNRNLIPLRPVMTAKTRVVQIRRLPAGTTVGYERTYTLSESARVATLSVGYSDGFPRLLSNRGKVLVGGEERPVIGRVTMNIINVRLEESDPVSVGDEVVLMGKQGNRVIHAGDIAQQLGTIPYEVLTSFGNMSRRVYIEDSEYLKDTRSFLQTVDFQATGRQVVAPHPG